MQLEKREQQRIKEHLSAVCGQALCSVCYLIQRLHQPHEVETVVLFYT